MGLYWQVILLAVIFFLMKCLGIISSLDVNEVIQKDILVTIRVTLGIQSFGNGIGYEGGCFTIGKFNVINPRV